MRRLCRQITVLALVLVDIASLMFAVVAPVWLAPWVVINVTMLMLGSLSWSEDRRIQRENTTAMQRQGIKLRAAKWRNIEEMKRKVQSQRQEAERRQQQEEEDRETQRRLQAALRRTQEQLRQAQQEVREAEQRRYQEERATQRQQQRERAERARQAEEQRKKAEQTRRRAEKERKAQRERQGGHQRAASSFQTDWWTVLGVAPSASKDEIVRKYRHKIKQCHPDRLVEVGPELRELAEEQTKALNGAYENAMRARANSPRNFAAA
jgi:DnaJ-domain-containing protein 1